MFSAPALAVLLALIVSVLLVYCLPVWASLSITFAAVAIVAIGGGALLAKASVAGAVGVTVVWLWRHLRRRAMKQAPADMKVFAIPGARTKAPQADRRRTERQAA